MTGKSALFARQAVPTVDHKGAEAPTVAIVGGSGFIGRSLTQRLAGAGLRVRIVDVAPPVGLCEVEWVDCDIRDASGLGDALAGVRLVYNLAAARGTEPHSWETYRTLNIDGADNVCAAAASRGASRIVFTSSAAVYGSGDAPDERSECRPRGGYARSKLTAERVYEEWVRESRDRSLVIVRPTVVFGPGDDGAGNRLIGNAAHPSFELADRWGRRRKSLAFVENLAAFLAFVATRPGRIQLFNYCDVPDMTVHDIVSTVRSSLGLDPAPSTTRLSAYAVATRSSITRRLGRVAGPGLRGVRRASKERRFDAGRAHSSGFVQPTDLREGLAETARADLGWLSLVHRVGR